MTGDIGRGSRHRVDLSVQFMLHHRGNQNTTCNKLPTWFLVDDLTYKVDDAVYL